MNDIYKYPRTQHMAGSGIQHGDEDLAIVPFRELAGRNLVVEEKMDGANSAISFDANGNIQLQSRGHYLVGGPREKQFHLFKTWAHRYTAELWAALTDRYIMYGEWLYAKHTIFYTNLPHYFMEFDLYDKASNEFLSTERRRTFLAQLPFVVSVRVLQEGEWHAAPKLTALIGRSPFISDDQRERLRIICQEKKLDLAQALKETDPGTFMEGLYIKVEEEGIVKKRYKYVRASFLQTVIDAEGHWMDRPLLANCLNAGVTLF